MISKLYLNKNKTIAEFCSGKQVLDLGIVDHDVDYEKRKNWLHRDLKKVAKSIIGIDIDKKAINFLKKKGYNVLQANLENMNLHLKREIIVAGDIIEHLNNPGLAFESIKKHMQKNSELIITVPNCLSFTNFIELILFNKIKYFNEEHTHWYDEATIKRSLENYGFEIIESSFILHNPHFIGESPIRSLLKEIRYSFLYMLCKLRKQSAPTIFIRAKIK